VASNWEFGSYLSLWIALYRLGLAPRLAPGGRGPSIVAMQSDADLDDLAIAGTGRTPPRQCHGIASAPQSLDLNRGSPSIHNLGHRFRARTTAREEARGQPIATKRPLAPSDHRSVTRTGLPARSALHSADRSVGAGARDAEHRFWVVFPARRTSSRNEDRVAVAGTEPGLLLYGLAGGQ
jgi:hypothetical protein